LLFVYLLLGIILADIIINNAHIPL